MQRANYMRSCIRFIAAAVATMVLTAAAAAQDPLPVRWDRQSAGALLAFIERIDSHGLNAKDYEPVELLGALGSADSRDIDRQATESFALVAADLAAGRVRPGRRGRYFIASDALDPVRIARLIDIAIVSRQVGATLESLAPRNQEYRALRQALARLDSPAGPDGRKIKVSLERWRWLPRDLGRRHLLVNIPEYRLRLIDDGRVVASHRVIVGKKSTPTPQFSTEVTAVILNPSWHVPQSIIAESVGSLVRSRPDEARRRGYVWASDAAGRLQVTQQPGAQNALGQMKLEMANPLSIYIHDTPNKNLFEREERTFSHGCIRTQDPLGLAAVLLAGTPWSRERIDRSVAGSSTTRAALARSLPVFAVYMTAMPQPDGSIRYLDDPYNLDAAIAAQLER